MHEARSSASWATVGHKLYTFGGAVNDKGKSAEFFDVEAGRTSSKYIILHWMAEINSWKMVYNVIKNANMYICQYEYE